MAGCGADDLANELEGSLVGDADFSVDLPDLSGDEFQVPALEDNPLFGDIAALTNADLTTVSLDGTGTFDLLMKAFKLHLEKEKDSNRIAGSEYTKAYIALTSEAMSGAVQFLMGRDTARWQAINAQIAAQIAQVQLVNARVALEAEKTKLTVLALDALNRQAEYALTKMRLSTESANYCIAKYELEQMLPQKKLLLVQQTEQAEAEVNLTEKRISLVQTEIDRAPVQTELIQKQIAHQTAETLGQTKQNILLDDEHLQSPKKLEMLEKQILHQVAQTEYTAKQGDLIDLEIAQGPKKLELLIAQVGQQTAQTQLAEAQVELAQEELAMMPDKKKLIAEQAEAMRAETLDTRSDGATVAGTKGKQVALYDQQIISYQRDSEIKGAKIFADAWITMKTLDEGLGAPGAFTNATLDSVMGSVKSNLGL